MKRIISLIIVFAILLTACSNSVDNKASVASETTTETATGAVSITVENDVTLIDENVLKAEEDYLASLSFSGMDDPELLQLVEDYVYADLAKSLDSEEYRIEQVEAIYISKEYLEDLEHNSQANIFFGYTMDELELEFAGSKFEFTTNESGQTVVREFEEYDDTEERIIKNAAIGAGVIVVLVVVTIVTYGSDIPAVAAVCAVSGGAAKGAAIGAASGAFISASISGVITGLQTQDLEATLKAAALSGSEGFKWGAITGAISGGFGKAIELKNAATAAEAIESGTVGANSIPSWRESELAALSKYGGTEQVSYLAGEEVPFGTPGATRPDIVRDVGNTLEAIEVKNYNLASPNSLGTLYSELKREISARVANLPAGTTQRVVLDVTGRGFSPELIEGAKQGIWETLADIYPNIPIDIMG